ncbi:hypothetical protein [Nitrosopumilus sp.]|uniref:hypothetical protein n=1 Tax=Nitrosopumilus sp. TaxID=2024843 RepID=UPI00247B5AC0|nr:hypothetical protein [Nitrosopumilus sp.]MCV0431650.1 hypothetical protein [Nitrosopumilus sp.]
MRKILDRILTGFFVIIFGGIWYCTRCFVVTNQYKVIIHDVFGNQIQVDGIRTNFQTSKAANNFISEYQNRFSHYNFSLASEMPITKRNWLFQKLKRN